MKICKRGHQYGEDAKTCRECRQLSNRRWKASNPDKVKAERKKYYATNRQSLVAKQREYFNQNPEKVKTSRRDAVRKWDAANPDKKRKTARSCAIKRNYGITPEQWEQMFVAQGRRCAICKSETSRANRDWATDHCHVGGNVRGILCHPCNKGLGHFGDNIQFLQAAVSYLLAEMGATA